MLTRRGSWFILTVSFVLAGSLGTETTSISLICLTLLAWFLAGWLAFQIRSILVYGKLHIEREVNGDQGPVTNLWAGRDFEVRVRLLNRSIVSLPYVCIHERVPFGVEYLGGDITADGSFTSSGPITLRYRIRPLSPGRVRFEGITVRIADLQGFFYRRLFVQNVQHFRVSPALADAKGRFSMAKRHNLLPLIGAHRHRRPGSGSELLDLRDYMPGDPPKRIAWKASARRDRLMTKEFESEVPIRCTLFVDASNSVRVGLPGHNALARLIEVSTVVAQANLAARDLTGLCLFDEMGTTILKPARGTSHLSRLYALLADAATLSPATGQVEVAALLPLAYGLSDEVYPHLLESDVNYFPWWLPFWAPQPVDALWRSQVAVSWSKRFAKWVGHTIHQQFIGRLLPRRWKGYRWRKKLAAIFAARHKLGPGMLAILLADDERFVLEMQRFLNEHHVPFDLPLYGPRNDYLFAAPRKVEVLATGLRQAVGRGRDNELFVLLADLLEISDHLDPLLAAVKMAAARHHSVIVVCPWPPGVPPPDRSSREAEKRDAKFKAALSQLVNGNDADGVLRFVLRHTGMLRLHRAYDDVRHAFARLGVPVACALHDESVRLILSRMERLRMLERGVR